MNNLLKQYHESLSPDASLRQVVEGAKAAARLVDILKPIVKKCISEYFGEDEALREDLLNAGMAGAYASLSTCCPDSASLWDNISNARRHIKYYMAIAYLQEVPAWEK